MTKEITKTIILQELQDKLRLREFTPAKFLFDETVVPVYDIEHHLRNCSAKHIVTSVTSATGKVLTTVPDNERWFINGYTTIFYNGSYTVAGVYVVRKNTPTIFVYLDLEAAQSVAYTVNLPKVLRMDPGDALYVNIDGFTTSGQFHVELDYEVEEIR